MSTEKELMDKIETYNFQCDAGSLIACAEWSQLKELLEFDEIGLEELEASKQEAPPAPPAPPAEPTPLTFDQAVAEAKDGGKPIKRPTWLDGAALELTQEDVLANDWQIVG